MARPSKFLRVILAGTLNFLQRDLEKYLSSQKNYILEKILSQKTTFFSIFVPKITVSDIKKIGVFGIFPKFSVKSH
tara:strand:+ start:81 stop:308 length:228 start_codon:yes stop_codon:yes gene_type:complete